MAFAVSFMSAQTTFDLDWAIGINGADASITIETGDTVRWTLADNSPHTVSSIAGSQETFDSGTISGNGTQYSYTFTDVGTNDYQCNIHPGSMFGTITVELVLSIEDKFAQNISFYPNPVQDKLTVLSLYKLDSYVIYDVLGKKVVQGLATGNTTQLDMSGLNSGLYFVTAISGDLSSTFKVNKR